MAASAGDGRGRLIKSNGSSRRAWRRRIRCGGSAPLWSELQYAVHLATARTGRNDVAKTVNIVPVRVVEATPTATATASASMGRMEIVLVGGERIVIGADVDATALARIIKVLTRR